MGDPVAIERSYRNLLHQLSFPASPRQRLLAINGFIASLDHSYLEHESYLLELGEQLARIIPKVDFRGFDPRSLIGISDTLSAALDAVPSLQRIPDVRDASATLRNAVAGMFACLGEVRECLGMLEDRYRNAPPDWLTRLQSEQDAPPLTRLEKALHQLRSDDPATAYRVAVIIEEWSATGPELSAHVPVVEHPLVPFDGLREQSSLRRVNLRVLGRAQAKDDVHADVSVFGAHTDASQVTEVSLAAARSLVREKEPQLAKHYITAQLTFEGYHALHEGASANLAIAVLLFCGIQQQANLRNRFLVSRDAVITGAIDPRGAVLPVDPASIAEKARATFFSPAECLVVPKEQEAQAMHAVAALSAFYPRKRLAIVGVSHLRELFFDRRITRATRIPFFQYVGRAVANAPRPLLVAALMVMALLFGLFLYGPIDKNPVGYSAEGDILSLLNKNGQVVEEIHVGSYTVNNWVGGKTLGYRPVAFADVDGDGRNEVFWFDFTTQSTRPPVVKGKKVPGEELLWSYTMTKEMHFPLSADVNSPHFFPKQILVDDFDGDGSIEVLVNATNNAFPGLILQLDARTGTEMSHYLHIGHLADMRVWDLDGDGDKEIILAGTNNSIRLACFVVLDPRRLDGHGPAQGDYIPDGYQRAAEKAYIKIPRTILGEKYKQVVKYNWAVSMWVDHEKKTIALMLSDVHSLNVPAHENVSATYFLYFDFTLKPLSVTSGDDFDALYDYHVEQGDIPNVNRNVYLREYVKRVEEENRR